MDLPQRHGDTELDQINKITERIIGCAIEVHRVLRCGLFEAVYRSALAIEFDAAGLVVRTRGIGARDVQGTAARLVSDRLRRRGSCDR